MLLKLLIPCGLLATGVYLGATALAEDRALNEKLHRDLTKANIEPNLAETEAPEPEATPQTAVRSSEAEFPTIDAPLFSSLILPLPPLLLPDLLLPPYDFPSFNSQRLDEELQIYSRYLRTYGTPDVLIVGSSRSLQGIDPLALQEGLEAQGYSGVKVFNFGINGATAQVIDVLLNEVLTDDHLPKLIIWGDGLRAFNDGRPDLTYREIVGSEGYRRLSQGDRPIPSRLYEDSPILTASTEQSIVTSTLTESVQQTISADLDMYGFQTITEQFDPAAYYSQYPRVSGNFDADYVPFALGQEQTASTIAVAEFARSHDVPLVIVNLPLTQDYMDSIRQSYERQFIQHMQQLAQQRSFTFLNLNQSPDLTQNRYFADPSHINQHGARAVALHLAANPNVPWQRLRTKQD
ncbi:hypothetical protein C7B61_03285 [filamentous cyanobacterium CCP1]|nr:hypothetical protein C7B76_24380 [filamentous cyanobacterium CCP2]PSB67978.1 hypothetical protein C7B61_03285 [filamentous cyanobacterium CCP1]